MVICIAEIFYSVYCSAPIEQHIKRTAFKLSATLLFWLSLSHKIKLDYEKSNLYIYDIHFTNTNNYNKNKHTGLW